MGTFSFAALAACGAVFGALVMSAAFVLSLLVIYGITCVLGRIGDIVLSLLGKG